MKLKKKTIFLIPIFAILFLTMSQLLNPQVESTNSKLMLSSVPSDKSAYVNYTGPLIDTGYGIRYVRMFIDDTHIDYNWNKTTSENSWINGTGTSLDPYIIENLYINGNGSGGMIYIKDSTKYFIIRNCWFDNSGSDDAGVYFFRTSNGIVDNNIFTYTDEAVFITTFSHNNSVIDNLMISDNVGRAIDIQGESHNNLIYNNKIINYNHGIYMSTSNNSTINGNYIENTIFGDDYEGYPIYFSICNYSKIVANVLAGAFAYGSFQISEVGCIGNILEGNQVIINQTMALGLEPTCPLKIGQPRLQASPTNVITLEYSNFNHIAYNKMLIGGPNDIIPSYDPFLFVGMICIISVILLIRFKHIGRNKNKNRG